MNDNMNGISKQLPRLLLGALLLFNASVLHANPGQFIDLMPKNDAEVNLILETLEAAINDNQANGLPPIVMMLHGNQAHRFVRRNYEENKSLVDQTAKLAAYGILDVKICETWMRGNNYTNQDLFPFINSVPLGSAELERLSEEEGYTEYSVSM